MCTRQAKKSGDTREEVGATAKNRKPREEEGPSDLRSASREDYCRFVECYDRQMLHLHNTPESNAAMQQMHTYC